MAAPTAATQAARKILFVGDSLTYFNDGIYSHLERLGGSANPALTIHGDQAVRGGAPLKTLWEMDQVRQAIGKGGYEVVVLQEDLPETKVDIFREYARKFVEDIRKAGSRPVLLMAWSYERLGWISMAEIAQAHRDAAKELGVDVAPVGLAWQRVLKERPDINLFARDREHPSIEGTYLAAVVVYATVFGRNPNGLRYLPSGVTADAAAFLQRVAWETLQEYRSLR